MASKQTIILALVAAGIPEDGLADKTNAQLVALAKENNVVYSGEPPAAAALQAGDDAEIDDSDPRTGRKIKVRIEIGAEAGGKEDVFASVNGYNFVAKRGKEIELDEGFVRHLENVETTDVEAVIGDNGRPTGEVVEIPRRRFQISRL